MDKKTLEELIKDIETVHSHLVIFRESYSFILRRAPKATKAHLLVFHQVFPYLENLLNFVRSILPTLNKMDETLPNSSDKLPEAAQNLIKVTEATELATTEIMDVVEDVMSKLNNIGNQQNLSENIKNDLNQSSDKLFNILNALQFQDITTQQIESIKSIISNVNTDLANLVSEFNDLKIQKIEFSEKIFDEKAVYDKDVAKERQKMVDEMFKTGKKIQESSKKDKREKPKKEEDIVTQEKVNELFSKKELKEDKKPEKDDKKVLKDSVDEKKDKSDDKDKDKKEDKNKGGEKFSQDDIDSLFN